MPKDDWAKYRNRDRARQAYRSGSYDKAGSGVGPVNSKRHRRRKNHDGTRIPVQPGECIVTTKSGVTMRYNARCPELATIREFISGPKDRSDIPWPGFSYTSDFTLRTPAK